VLPADGVIKIQFVSFSVLLACVRVGASPGGMKNSRNNAHSLIFTTVEHAKCALADSKDQVTYICGKLKRVIYDLMIDHD
jgi:hypothetical protein